MTLGEILRLALVDTALGMGTVFAILIFISICIWIMGVLCRERETTPAGAAASQTNVSEEPAGIPPETIAVITAAIHQYMKDEEGDNEEYIVRNVRRATWRHTS